MITLVALLCLATIVSVGSAMREQAPTKKVKRFFVSFGLTLPAIFAITFDRFASSGRDGWNLSVLLIYGAVFLLYGLGAFFARRESKNSTRQPVP
jgi:hypothetical protein